MQNDKFYTLEQSEFSIKMSEISALDSPRPLGISGHLRVKNEPETVALSIITALPALDELIITCQPYINESGCDETYKQCLMLQTKFPNKIRLFYYTPKVVATNGSHIKNNSQEIQSILQKFNGKVPSNSIHSLAHYYNFGLVKIRFKYYVKIDADQIYLTDKLQMLREKILYLDFMQKNRQNKIKRYAGKIFFSFLFPLIPFGLQKIELTSFIKILLVLNDRIAFGLMGINIGHRRTQEHRLHLKTLKKLYIPLNSSKNNGFRTFNGGYDNPIIPITSDNLYVMHKKKQY